MSFFTFWWAFSGMLIYSLTLECVLEPTAVIPGSSFEEFAYLTLKEVSIEPGFLSKYSRKN